MTRIERLSIVAVSPLVAWALYLNVVDPVWATPQAGQPALVFDHAAYGVDGPSGFDQARGARR